MRERETQMYLNFEQPRVMERVFSNMDSEVADTLTPKQKQGIERAITRSFLCPSKKVIDLRWVFPCIRTHYYIVLYMGQNLRSEEPRFFTRHLSRTRWLANSILVLFVSGYALCGIIGLIYIIQRILGFSFL